MPTQEITPELALGLHVKRQGETIYIGIATFLAAGCLLLGSASSTADAPAPRISTTTVPVSQSLGDALSEGEESGQSRAWESCFTDGRMITCPDGFEQKL